MLVGHDKESDNIDVPRLHVHISLNGTNITASGHICYAPALM